VENQVEDQPVLNHIQRLVAEEHRLHEQRAQCLLRKGAQNIQTQGLLFVELLMPLETR
jgi:hypothetical protein